MPRLILFNKPFGVLSQFTDRADATPRATLSDHLPLPGVYPAGRLDRDSEGLLLLTDDGRLQARISDPRFKLPKTYLVQVEGLPDAAALERLRTGVALKDGPTRPAGVARIDAPALWPRVPPIRVRQSVPDCWLRITLREGRNRQVRRMTAALGHPTLRLVRWAVGDWTVAGLAPGDWRELALPDADTNSGGGGRPARVPRTRRKDSRAGGPAVRQVFSTETVAPPVNVAGRRDRRCDACAARFLDPAQPPGAAEDRARYLLHRNDCDAPHYRCFHSKLATPRLASGGSGPDKGCGSAPALAAILREAGHRVALWGPLLAADPGPLADSHDFVTRSDSAGTFQRPGSWLAPMTCCQSDDAHLTYGHRRKEPTHLMFDRAGTCHHLAPRWGLGCAVPAKDVRLPRRPPA